MATPALAGNWKTFSGFICRDINGSSFFRPQNSIATNTTDQTMTVVCPLERDSTATTGGLTQLLVYVKRYSFPVTCWAESLDSAGFVLRGTSVYSDVSGVVTFGPAVSKSSMDSGTYNLYCALPRTTGIVAIRYDESTR